MDSNYDDGLESLLGKTSGEPSALAAQSSSMGGNVNNSSRGTGPRQSLDATAWLPLGNDALMSDSVSTAPSSISTLSYAQPSTAPTNPSRGSVQHASSTPTALLSSAAKRRLGHEKKRAKLDATTVAAEGSALDSVDYWIQFDDDDPDGRPGESFEIDFSKRAGANSNAARAKPKFNASSSTTPGLGTGQYTTATAFKADDFVDDSALDNALSEDDDLFDSVDLEEQLSKIDSQAPPEIPPREGLYSTPLSWERPQPGPRINPLFGGFGATTPTLTEEQRRLLAIAFNTGKQPSSVPASLGFDDVSNLLGLPLVPSLATFNPGFASAGLSQFPDFSDDAISPRGGTLKRESTQDGTASAAGSSKSASQKFQGKQAARASEKAKEKPKSGTRAAHNDIERKYRTNLKDKIAELRDAIPSLRSLPDEDTDRGEGDSSRAPKASKGTVLTKATEYIHHLERRNRTIMQEHEELSRRLQAFEQLLTSTVRQPFPMPNYSRALFDPRGFC